MNSMDFFFDIFPVLIRAWKKGHPAHRWAVVICVIASSLAAIVLGLKLAFHAPEELTTNIAIGFLGIAAAAYLFLKAVVDVEAKIEINKRVERAEHAVAEHPLDARPLWDLARTRLELYFERNLSQINTIFWVTVLVMIAGFVMIFYGIFRAFDSPNIQPSIVAAASGIVTEFIAATFLVISGQLWRRPVNT
jgi:uncharacterized membrane protein YfcA